MQPKLLLIFFVLLTTKTFSQNGSCNGGCPQPRISLYDFDVQVSEPDAKTEPDQWAQWKKLFSVAPYASNYFTYSDPSGNCLRFLNEGGLTNLNQVINAISALPQPRLPQPGALAGDYIITGKIIGADNQYTVILILETAVSRKVVQTASASFSLSDADACSKAATEAASKLSPLFQTIKNFEEKEREADAHIAIGETNRSAHRSGTANQLLVKPQKSKMAYNEEITVAIEMKDCDGYALKNREITFKVTDENGLSSMGTTGGTVTPSKVVTDANGKAQVKFKAASNATSAVIMAYYLYQQPCGRKQVLSGSAPVSIKTKPWKVVMYYTKEMSTTTDKTAPSADFTVITRGHDHFSVQHQTVFYYDYKQPLDSNFSIAPTDDEEVAKVIYETEKGTSEDMSFYNEKRIDHGGHMVFDINSNATTFGKAVPQERALLSFQSDTYKKPIRLDSANASKLDSVATAMGVDKLVKKQDKLLELANSMRQVFTMNLSYRIRGNLNGKALEEDILPVANLTLMNSTPGVKISSGWIHAKEDVLESLFYDWFYEVEYDHTETSEEGGTKVTTNEKLFFKVYIP